MGISVVDPASALASGTLTVLYGPPGEGKTTAAATAPGPILWCNAEGPRRLRFARKAHPGKDIVEVDATTRVGLLAVVDELKKNPGVAETIVVDTSGEVYAALVQEFAGSGKPRQDHYGDGVYVLERFLRELIRTGKHVVVICHEETSERDDGTMLMPSTGGRKLPAKVCAWADVVAYVGVGPSGEDGSRGPTLGQLAGGSGRYAKDSSGALGAYREVDLTEWYSHF